MAGRRQHQIDAEARRNWSRYQEAISLARQWMRETDSNQRGLAERLGETEASVSRFMTGTLEHAPCKYRQAKVRLLEKVEDLCADPTTISSHNLYTQNVGAMSDERYWLIVNEHRTMALLKEKYAGRVLIRLRSHFVEAIHGPAPEKYYACTNVLLAFSETVARLHRDPASNGSDTLCSHELVRDSIKRAQRLRDTALDGFSKIPIDWEPAKEESKTIGYGGLCEAAGGVVVGDEELLIQGVEAMSAAAAMPHRRQAWLWPNLLLFIDKLLLDKHPLGSQLSAQVAAHAGDHPSEHLGWTLRTRSIENVKAHWATVAPGLWEAV